MAVSITTRMGVYRWTSDTDQYSRDQLDLSHLNLENNSVKWGQREAGEAVRPSPSTTWRGALYYNRETSVMSYSDGNEWVDIPTIRTISAIPTIVLGDGVVFQTGTTTGLKIGTSTSQKIGFFNATPVIQQANTVSNRVALQNLGLIATGGDARFDVRLIPSATARPAAGVLGEMIWEERTSTLFVSNGSAWIAVGDPCGTVKPFVGTTAPAGWLFCNGGTFTAATFPELNTLLGGNTLPDLRDRGVVGRVNTSDAYSGTATGQANITTSPVLFAFTPDITTTAPGGSDIQAKALGNAETTSNVSPSVRMNWIIKV